MARIELQSPDADGVVLDANKDVEDGALVWVANGIHKYNNTGLEFLEITKGAGAAVMKLHTQVPVSETYGLQLPDDTVNIAANTTKIYGPYSPGAFNERPGATDAGHTGISFDNVVGLKVKAIRPLPAIA